MYLEKSFFKIRIRMIVKKAVSNITSTKELIMLSQWISKELGKKVESAYRFILCSYLISGVCTHSTEKENTIWWLFVYFCCWV